MFEAIVENGFGDDPVGSFDGLTKMHKSTCYWQMAFHGLEG
jgi:hypothetical protein